MRYGYTIIYVDDVKATLEAWEAAFGATRRMLTPENDYAELDTGATTISFANREFGRSHFTDEVTRSLFDGAPSRFEIGFVTDDVAAAWQRAVDAGMTAVVPPVTKSWGQTVGWVRDANDILIEIASPMG